MAGEFRKALAEVRTRKPVAAVEEPVDRVEAPAEERGSFRRALAEVRSAKFENPFGGPNDTAIMPMTRRRGFQNPFAEPERPAPRPRSEFAPEDDSEFEYKPTAHDAVGNILKGVFNRSGDRAPLREGAAQMTAGTRAFTRSASDAMSSPYAIQEFLGEAMEAPGGKTYREQFLEKHPEMKPPPVWRNPIGYLKSTMTPFEKTGVPPIGWSPAREGMDPISYNLNVAGEAVGRWLGLTKTFGLGFMPSAILGAGTELGALATGADLSYIDARQQWLSDPRRWLPVGDSGRSEWLDEGAQLEASKPDKHDVRMEALRRLDEGGYLPSWDAIKSGRFPLHMPSMVMEGTKRAINDPASAIAEEPFDTMFGIHGWKTVAGKGRALAAGGEQLLRERRVQNEAERVLKERVNSEGDPRLTDEVEAEKHARTRADIDAREAAIPDGVRERREEAESGDGGIPYRRRAEVFERIGAESGDPFPGERSGDAYRQWVERNKDAIEAERASVDHQSEPPWERYEREEREAVAEAREEVGRREAAPRAFVVMNAAEYEAFQRDGVVRRSPRTNVTTHSGAAESMRAEAGEGAQVVTVRLPRGNMVPAGRVKGLYRLSKDVDVKKFRAEAGVREKKRGYGVEPSAGVEPMRRGVGERALGATATGFGYAEKYNPVHLAVRAAYKGAKRASPVINDAITRFENLVKDTADPYLRDSRYTNRVREVKRTAQRWFYRSRSYWEREIDTYMKPLTGAEKEDFAAQAMGIASVLDTENRSLPMQRALRWWKDIGDDARAEALRHGQLGEVEAWLRAYQPMRIERFGAESELALQRRRMRERAKGVTHTQPVQRLYQEIREGLSDAATSEAMRAFDERKKAVDGGAEQRDNMVTSLAAAGAEVQRAAEKRRPALTRTGEWFSKQMLDGYMAELAPGEKPRITEDMTHYTALLHDWFARKWAKETGKSPEDYYFENIYGATAGWGGGVGEGAGGRNTLYQRMHLVDKVRSDPGEYFSRLREAISASSASDFAPPGKAKDFDVDTPLDPAHTEKVIEKLREKHGISKAEVEATAVREFLRAKENIDVLVGEMNKFLNEDVERSFEMQEESRPRQIQEVLSLAIQKAASWADPDNGEKVNRPSPTQHGQGGRISADYVRNYATLLTSGERNRLAHLIPALGLLVGALKRAYPEIGVTVDVRRKGEVIKVHGLDAPSVGSLARWVDSAHPKLVDYYITDPSIVNLADVYKAGRAAYESVHSEANKDKPKTEQDAVAERRREAAFAAVGKVAGEYARREDRPEYLKHLSEIVLNLWLHGAVGNKLPARGLRKDRMLSILEFFPGADLDAKAKAAREWYAEYLESVDVGEEIALVDPKATISAINTSRYAAPHGGEGIMYPTDPVQRRVGAQYTSAGGANYSIRVSEQLSYNRMRSEVIRYVDAMRNAADANKGGSWMELADEMEKRRQNGTSFAPFTDPMGDIHLFHAAMHRPLPTGGHWSGYSEYDLISHARSQITKTKDGMSLLRIDETQTDPGQYGLGEFPDKPMPKELRARLPEMLGAVDKAFSVLRDRGIDDTAIMNALYHGLEPAALAALTPEKRLELLASNAHYSTSAQLMAYGESMLKLYDESAKKNADEAAKPEAEAPNASTGDPASDLMAASMKPTKSEVRRAQQILERSKATADAEALKRSVAEREEFIQLVSEMNKKIALAAASYVDPPNTAARTIWPWGKDRLVDDHQVYRMILEAYANGLPGITWVPGVAQAWRNHHLSADLFDWPRFEEGSDVGGTYEFRSLTDIERTGNFLYGFGLPPSALKMTDMRGRKFDPAGHAVVNRKKLGEMFYMKGETPGAPKAMADALAEANRASEAVRLLWPGSEAGQTPLARLRAFEEELYAKHGDQWEQVVQPRTEASEKRSEPAPVEVIEKMEAGLSRLPEEARNAQIARAKAQLERKHGKPWSELEQMPRAKAAKTAAQEEREAWNSPDGIKLYWLRKQAEAFQQLADNTIMDNSLGRAFGEALFDEAWASIANAIEKDAGANESIEYKGRSYASIMRREEGNPARGFAHSSIAASRFPGADQVMLSGGYGSRDYMDKQMANRFLSKIKQVLLENGAPKEAVDQIRFRMRDIDVTSYEGEGRPSAINPPDEVANITREELEQMRAKLNELTSQLRDEPGVNPDLKAGLIATMRSYGVNLDELVYYGSQPGQTIGEMNSSSYKQAVLRGLLPPGAQMAPGAAPIKLKFMKLPTIEWGADLTKYLNRAPLMQREGRLGNVKGAVEFLNDGRAVMRMFAATDATTLVHESAHIFRRFLPPELLKHAEEMYGVTGGVWTIPQEEAFAENFEGYMLGGRAPDRKAAEVYQRFAGWLQAIYTTKYQRDQRGGQHPANRALFAQMLGFDPAAEQIGPQGHEPFPISSWGHGGDKLESARRRFDMKVSEASARTGVPEEKIREYEKTGTGLNDAEIGKLAETYGLDADEMIEAAHKEPYASQTWTPRSSSTWDNPARSSANVGGPVEAEVTRIAPGFNKWRNKVLREAKRQGVDLSGEKTSRMAGVHAAGLTPREAVEALVRAADEKPVVTPEQAMQEPGFKRFVAEVEAHLGQRVTDQHDLAYLESLHFFGDDPATAAQALGIPKKSGDPVDAMPEAAITKYEKKFRKKVTSWTDDDWSRALADWEEKDAARGAGRDPDVLYQTDRSYEREYAESLPEGSAMRELALQTAQLSEELRAKGKEAPLYFPFMRQPRPLYEYLSPGGFLRRPKSDRFKHSTGAAFASGKYEKDPSKVMRSWLLSRLRQHTFLVTLESIIKDPEIGAREWKKGDEIDEATEALLPVDAITQSVLAQSRMEQSLKENVERIGLVDESIAATMRQMLDDNSFENLANNTQKGRVYVVPKAVKKALASEYSGAPKWVRLMIDQPTKYWVGWTLFMRPAWLVNNMLTSALVSMISGTGPKSAVRALREDWIAKTPQDFRVGGFSSQIASSQPHLGRAADSGLGALYEWIDRQPVSMVVGEAQAHMRGFNEGIEEYFRRATYLSQAAKQARKNYVKRTGDNFYRAFNEMQEIDSMTPEQVQSVIKKVNFWMGEYDNLYPFERQVVKRIIPFYSFMRYQLQLAAGLPIEAPLRTAMLAGMVKAVQRDIEESEENLPEYMRGKGLVNTGLHMTVNGRELMLYYSGQGWNPFNLSGLSAAGEVKDAGDLERALLSQGGPVTTYPMAALTRKTGIGTAFKEPGTVEINGRFYRKVQDLRGYGGKVVKIHPHAGVAEVQAPIPNPAEYYFGSFPQTQLAVRMINPNAGYSAEPFSLESSRGPAPATERTRLLELLRYFTGGSFVLVDPKAQKEYPIRRSTLRAIERKLATQGKRPMVGRRP